MYKRQDIEYVLSSAVLDNVYTPEAYALCKEWEFKNLLSRFQIETPKNEVEDAFTFAKDADAFLAFVKKACEASCTDIGVYVAWRQKSASEWSEQVSAVSYTHLALRGKTRLCIMRRQQH